MSDTTDMTESQIAAGVSSDRDARGATDHIRAMSHRRLLREFIWVFDILLCFVTAQITTIGYHLVVYGHHGYLLVESSILGGLAGVLFAVFAAGQGLYKPGGVFFFGEQVGIILRVWMLVALFFLGMLFVTQSGSAASRGVSLLFLVVVPSLLILSRLVANRIAVSLTRAGGPLNLRVAVVGPPTETEAFLKLSSGGAIGLSVMGVFDPDRTADTPAEARSGHKEDLIRGSIEDLKRVARETRVDQIVITLPWRDAERIVAIVDDVAGIPVPISLSPDPAAFRFAGHTVKIIGGVPYFDVRPRRIDGAAGFAKVAMDKLLSILLLLLLSPLLLIVALAIKLTSRGPVFFMQRRHGFNHDIFSIMKFRTMTTTDDGPVVRQAQRGDARITKVGGFLRKTSIDELPQLINVLRGEMSLVGPRPHALAHNEEYAKILARYARRHNVKPGITGWAQVNGYRGETDTLDKMDGRVAHDLWYIEHWSFWLDIKILFMTAIKVLRQDNAY